MDQLSKDVAAIAASLAQINLRIDRLENGSPQPTQRPQAQAQPAAENEIQSLPAEFDIQSCFNAIKSALATQKKPPSLIMSTDKTEVRKADQLVHNILVKVSKFTETIIKIIQSPNSTI